MSEDHCKKSAIRVCVRLRPILENQSKTKQNKTYPWKFSSGNVVSFPEEFWKKRFRVTTPKKNSRDELKRHIFHNRTYPSFERDKTNDKKSMAELKFYRAFNSSSSNEEVYRDIIQDRVKASLEGSSCVFLAYGQTGSGKTHTMIGGSSSRGLILMAIDDIFTGVGNGITQSGGSSYEIRVSFFQIYNENIFDLLTDKKKPPTGKNGPRNSHWGSKSYSSGYFRPDNHSSNLPYLDSIHLSMINDVIVSNAEKAAQLISRAEQRGRTVATTELNERSSRSHAFCIIRVIHYLVDNMNPEPETLPEDTLPGRTMVSEGILCFVDLAGSERVSSSVSTRETGYINKSLFFLSNVVSAMVEKEKSELGDICKKHVHVPWRDSFLTRILRPFLDTSYTSEIFRRSTEIPISRFCVIFVCLHPSEESHVIEQNVQALKFATNAASLILVSTIADKLSSKSNNCENRRIGTITSEKEKEKMDRYEMKIVASETIITELKEQVEELSTKLSSISETKNGEKSNVIQSNNETMDKLIINLNCALKLAKRKHQRLIDRVREHIKSDSNKNGSSVSITTSHNITSSHIKSPCGTMDNICIPTDMCNKTNSLDVSSEFPLSTKSSSHSHNEIPSNIGINSEIITRDISQPSSHSSSTCTIPDSMEFCENCDVIKDLRRYTSGIAKNGTDNSKRNRAGEEGMREPNSPSDRQIEMVSLKDEYENNMYSLDNTERTTDSTNGVEVISTSNIFQSTVSTTVTDLYKTEINGTSNIQVSSVIPKTDCPSLVNRLSIAVHRRRVGRGNT